MIFNNNIEHEGIDIKNILKNNLSYKYKEYNGIKWVI